MDIKRQLADDVCEALGYRIFPGRCDICGFPLLEKCLLNTWFIGCWFCKNKKDFVVSARAALHKARMAEMGIIMDPPKTPVILRKPEEDTGARNMYGSPL